MAEKTKTIEGATYTLRPPAVKVAREIAFRVGRMMVGVLADTQNPGAAIAFVLARLPYEDVEWIGARFESYCEVTMPDGKTPLLSNVSEVWWLERQGEWIEWLAWCVEVTCTPFFAGLLRVIAARGGVAAKESSSPNPSTG